MLLYGRKYPDAPAALRWFIAAAEAHRETAALELATIYEEGAIVPQNFAEAYFWVSLAITRMNQERSKPWREMRDRLAPRIGADALTNVQQRATDWLAAYQAKRDSSFHFWRTGVIAKAERMGASVSVVDIDDMLDNAGVYSPEQVAFLRGTKGLADFLQHTVAVWTMVWTGQEPSWFQRELDAWLRNGKVVGQAVQRAEPVSDAKE